MTFPLAYLSEIVTIKRRASVGSASRDSFNNPMYGGYSTGLTTIYSNMRVKLAFSRRDVVFAPTGERIEPSGVMYFNPNYILQPEDRVITSDGVEYNIIGLNKAIVAAGIVNHCEAILHIT